MTQTRMTTTKQPPRTWEETRAQNHERLRSKQSRAEQRAMHKQSVPPSVPTLPPTVVTAPTPTELELLFAKAAVCDRYLRWLVTSDRDDRLLLQAALERVRRLQLQLKGGW